MRRDGSLLLNLDFMMLPKILSTETVEGNTMLKHMNLSQKACLIGFLNEV